MGSEPPPSVLAVLVVKDGARWVKRALASLARQKYERLGVVAVDDGSSDGSAGLLERILGRRRVLRLGRSVGFPGAVGKALNLRAARQADYLLLIHDDTVLAPGAVAGLVEAAQSTEPVGVVGPKVLDPGGDQVLRGIGLSIDRFGYPYSPLERGEIDLGQYDSPREVLYVSSACMLVARDAWTRVGPLDDRLRPCHADLDFCWRTRIAGFRVIMDPGAVAYHGAVGDRGRRPGVRIERRLYLEERANVTALLKNYRLFTLLWILPLFLLQGVARVVALLAARRFSAARQVLAAWGWAVLRVPGTIRRRVRAQASRQVPDRHVTKLMVPATTRLRRWAGQASAALLPRREARAVPATREEVEGVPLSARVGGLLALYPGAVSLAVGVLLVLFAFRGVLFVSPLEGGSFPAFPDSATDMMRRFADVSTPGAFGAAGGASPALVPLALGSLLTLGNPQTLSRVIVAGAPLLAGVLAYRAMAGRTGERGTSIIAAAAYTLSAVALWAVSEGEIGFIVFLIGLPWLVHRVTEPFDGPVPRRVRWVVGTGLGLALIGSFFPDVWAPYALLVLLSAVIGGRAGSRGVGLGLALGAIALAAALAFPLAIELIQRSGGQAADLRAGTDYLSLLRLSPGEAPGSWLPALFLPLGGGLAFALTADQDRRPAWRAALAAAFAIPLAWLAGEGYVPAIAANPIAYLGLAAFALSVLIALAFRGLLRAPGSPRIRRLGFGALLVLVGGGALLQTGQALRGAWAVGENRIPPAYPVVRSSDPGFPFRVLWVGKLEGGAFPPPGGPPQGVVEARAASVRYAVRGRSGLSVLPIGLPASGSGYDFLDRSLRAILAGRVRHGGALLAPLGIAFVVAGQGDLPDAVGERLDAQLDLLPAQRAGGLVLYSNARSLPIAGVLPNEDPDGSVRATDVLAPADVSRFEVQPLDRAGAGAWRGRVDPSSPAPLLVSAEFNDDWTLQAGGAPGGDPFRAFGWAVGFEVPAGDQEVRAELGGQRARSIQVAVLVGLWIIALGLVARRAEQA